MKANILEKIYLSKDSIESIPNDDPLLQILSIKEDGDIEYTHTDSFIKKACEYLMEYEFNDSPSVADRRKRVENFKKYMKGE